MVDGEKNRWRAGEKTGIKKRKLGTSYLPPPGEINPELALFRDLRVRIA